VFKGFVQMPDDDSLWIETYSNIEWYSFWNRFVFE